MCIIKSLTLGTAEWNKVFRGREAIVSDMAGAPNNPSAVRFSGDLSALLDERRPRIAVVGTRDMSPHGKEYTIQIVSALAEWKDKPVIISGLAFGIDATAHRAALQAGLPTVAVVATGLDTVYPYRHTGLAEDITSSEGSGILTQFPDKTAPMSFNFLYRNRTLALLCDAVIVVESKSKGGAMVAAKLANDYDIPVYAVPGRPDDIRSRGCNELIRNKVAEPLFDFEELKKNSFFM